MKETETRGSWTKQIVDIMDFANQGVSLEGKGALALGMLLAAIVNPATGVVIFALALAAAKVTEKQQAYGSFELGDGYRIQQFSARGNQQFISGEQSLGTIGELLATLMNGFVRVLSQATGSEVGNIYFSRVDGDLGFYVRDLATGKVVALHKLGFTFVAPIDILGGYVGLRSKDTANYNSRRFFFMPYDRAEKTGDWTVGAWTASNELPAIVTAILRMPLRITAKNIGEVPVTIATAEGIGLETVDLRQIPQGRVTVLSPEIAPMTETTGIEVLGETTDAKGVALMVGDELHFVPKHSFSQAVSEAARMQARASV